MRSFNRMSLTAAMCTLVVLTLTGSAHNTDYLPLKPDSTEIQTNIKPIGNNVSALNTDNITTTSYSLYKKSIDLYQNTPDITALDLSDCYPTLDKHIHLNVSDITEPSGATVDDIKPFIEKRTQWEGLEDYIISLDNKINVIFLITVARAETGAGEVCVGDYNCFNIRNADGSYCDYNSYKESIDHFVKLILNEYIDKNGTWHEGTGIRDIAIHYSNHKWGEGIIDLSKEILEICEENRFSNA